METIDSVLAKRNSFECLLALLPIIPEAYRSRIPAARALWESRSIEWQRLVYYTLRKRIKRGEPIEPNLYYLLNDCKPEPENWNGKPGINGMMKTCPMVIAYYKPWGRYGVFTKQEAELFQMEHIEPLNAPSQLR